MARKPKFTRLQYAIPLVVTLVIFAVLAANHFLFSSAAGPFVSAEPELGTASLGATVVSDTTASGSKAVNFASPTTSGSVMNVVAVGDIQPPSTSTNASATAAASADADFILGLGDYQYQTGAMADYNNYFDKSWGPLVPKMYPVLAPNHDNYWEGDPVTYFNGGGAHGYKSPITFSSLAATDKGFTFDKVVGTNKWHFIAIPETCYRDSGCDMTAVGNWIAADMASHPNSTYKCTIAYWHSPFFGSDSSQHSNDEPNMGAWVKMLSDNKVDLVLQGHNHLYERFDPQDYTRTAKADGMRAFVVGTGGIGFYSFTSTAPNSVVRNANTYGVLKLTLKEGSYDWKFQPVSGGTFTDSGTGNCN
jgi:hypothetical protein